MSNFKPNDIVLYNDGTYLYVLTLKKVFTNGWCHFKERNEIGDISDCKKIDKIYQDNKPSKFPILSIK